MGTPSITDLKARYFVTKNGSFLEKEFISKEVIGRKVEFDEVIVPSPELESSSSQKSVPGYLHQLVMTLMMMIMKLLIKLLPNLVGQPEYDPNLMRYGNPVLEVMLLDHDEPTNYEEAMMSPDSAKWLEAMKSEI